jgi:hypothetical protein
MPSAVKPCVGAQMRLLGVLPPRTPLMTPSIALIDWCDGFEWDFGLLLVQLQRFGPLALEW